MEELTRRAARRLYEVSRDLYAPIIAAFAADWLKTLADRPDRVALCVARDGLSPFVAAQTLLRTQPHRFPGLRSSRVRLAYVSRRLATAALTQPARASLLDRYLREQGAGGTGPLTLVDVGIHGTIQDALQQLYPERQLRGCYLVLRRRAGDPNGAAKRGFLAELDVAPHSSLALATSWPPEPGWDLGGKLRWGNPVFLRRRSVHVLEDVWSGVSEGAEALHVGAPGRRVVAVRGPATSRAP